MSSFGRPYPGQIIGHRRDGRPIRLQAGGSVQVPEVAPAPPAEPAAPPAPAAPPQQQPPAPPSPSPPAAPAQQQTPAPATAAPAAPADVTDWKAEAERLKTEAEQARTERDRWKQQSRTQETRSKANHAELTKRDELLREIAAKVGVEFDDKPDPEELSRKLADQTKMTRQLTVERAVYLTAANAGANAAALLDSREFIGRTEQLDPDAADFAAQVADLVKDAAQQPRYQAVNPVQQQFQQGPAGQQPAAPDPAAQGQQQPAPAPRNPPAPASGADFSGAPGGNRLWTQQDYDYWTAPGRDRDGKVMASAIEQGLLANLGIGKPKKTSRR